MRYDNRTPSVVSYIAGVALLWTAGSGSCAEPLTMSPGMAARLRTVRAEIVSGRVHLVSAQRPSSSTSTTRSNGRTERLSIDARDDRPAIQYELRTPELRLEIKAAGAGELEITHQVDYRSAEQQRRRVVEFRQQPNHPVELSIVDRDQTETVTEENEQTITAAGLWHLQLAEPQVCGTYLNPLLEMLRADWNLAETTAEIEQQLLAHAILPADGRRREWQALIAQLASDRYSERRAADRQLRAAGTAVVPFLQTLDRRELDAEQWFRVRRMIDSFSAGAEEDTPLSVARRLAGDPRVWHSLLSRDGRQYYKPATSHLSRLLGEPIQFDPDADAEARQRQIDAIGRRITPRDSP